MPEDKTEQRPLDGKVENFLNALTSLTKSSNFWIDGNEEYQDHLDLKLMEGDVPDTRSDQVVATFKFDPTKNKYSTEI